MLFDLRSRGRRRTVQGVYLMLAVLMGGGLVLFGVGAGNGLGGLLNAFGGGGSTSGQQSAISQAEKSAIKATQVNPSSASAWASLIQARWSAASNDANSSGQFSAAGKTELSNLGQDYQRYKSLVTQPDSTVASLAARAYQYLGNFSSATSVWTDITAAEPTTATAFECLAANAYAANNTRIGDLASNKALSLVPADQRTLLKSRISQAKTDPSVAESC